ncbi:unnamed protein product [Bemisia tabaci]|uniref:Alpha-1,6-mannosyl-glycoprotein 2-beta-N-acetylglucosaminyltransferase n=1 Tax=Bemisia tabaci TaxID=7038 RepID=A0A9P0ACI0_BEMTA|nr:PREDICTED: alpha-1,6-mannosyl-glycoprotein 2-beta-N-acetylglucosaminyltransferase-like isoform X1 [Bemisia tabaci]XP_018904574.1 PREDICTED: alpha-1,6-mannosyl-glycoprotein 2-beta-N-acetylglucosaminyltransferase-like isoform X1 [Bemisia tabaci]XP_018904575.1 PREDICTED: alpha-1,6-mannosyl-glycoprotein 2-beta-N-acetylglucosaminyltransferase-like isoform X1 [Bemisia tabaci]XP_018904576.1 PREDICTED: alpha-1,6-mannosyl-glycoprotein 2-beta-N-acetylglucosaminyltransferase-like isoform X1 [Bemisia tab
MRVNGRSIRIPVTSQLARRRSSTCLRPLLFLFLVLFFWLQLYFTHIANSKADKGSSSADNDTVSDSISVFNMVPSAYQKYLTVKPSNFSGDNVPKVPDPYEIQRNIEKYNEMQTVLNQNIYGPLYNDSLVLVIQVHTRIMYLRHMIVSLAQAKGIENVLLVFSHDYYDDEINELVQTIDFCKVIQIFYPFSIQTHSNEFPGESPGDCPRNINKEQAIASRCNNALHPDVYGHYREAKFTQTKHHWWWKANRVFNQLEITRNHTGLVLFLEEDHYLAEDFIHVLGLMEKTARVTCPQCNIFSLGTYLKTYTYYDNAQKKEALRLVKKHQIYSSNAANSPPSPSWSFQVLPSLYQHYQKVEQTPWLSSKHNMGMAFNRSVWHEIYNCAKAFCTFDDYNWDWSLQHVSNNCLQHKLEALVMRSPRVFHIGECGVHHKSSCTSTIIISKVQKILQLASKHFYPKHLSVIFMTVKKKPLKKGNGGWGDIRDHELCLNMTIPQR